MNDSVKKRIDELKHVGRHPKASVMKAMEETGKKAVGCFPIYTPEELIYGAGAIPVGMWGGKATGTLSDKYLQSFCCSVMKANTQQCLSGEYDMLSAVLITAYCDTLKCVMENWKIFDTPFQVIPVVYPQNRKTSEGKLFFEEELQRVKGQLEKSLDVTIDEEALEAAWNIYEDYRETMRKFTDRMAEFPVTFDPVTRHLVLKASWFMDKAVYTEKIKAIMEGLSGEDPEESRGRKVILTGLMAEPESLLELFDENDFQVVADDLAQETRQFRATTEETGSIFARMADRLANQDGCAFLFDREKTRGERLIEMLREKNGDAVIFCQLKFCDPDEFDYPIVKEELEAAGVPLLLLEFEQQMENAEQLRTRVQSFAEMLG